MAAARYRLHREGRERRQSVQQHEVTVAAAVAAPARTLSAEDINALPVHVWSFSSTTSNASDTVATSTTSTTPSTLATLLTAAPIPHTSQASSGLGSGFEEISRDVLDALPAQGWRAWVAQVINTLPVWSFPTTTSNTSASIAVAAVAAAADQNTAQDTECSICVTPFQHGDIVKTLPCAHHFHSECVDKWLRQHGTTCPNCRHPAASTTPSA